MTEVKTWSEVASSNQDPSPDGWPEGQTRSSVNDSAREMMARLREWYEAPQWLDLLAGDGDFTVSKASDFVVNILSGDPVSATSKFPPGARVRVGDGSTWVKAIVTFSSYAVPDTSVLIAPDGASVVQAGADRIEVLVTKGELGTAAFSQVGTSPGSNPPYVPSIDDLGDGAELNMGHMNGFDADTVDGEHASDLLSAADGRSESLLVNSDFGVWQRGTLIDSTTFFPNDNGLYVPDQWVLLMGSTTTKPAAGLGVVDCFRSDTEFPVGIASSSAVLQANANLGAAPSEKVGLFEPMEARDCRHLRSSNVSLSTWFRISAGAAIGKVQMAVIEWTGVEDTLATVDCIQDWGALAGDTPALAANYVYSGNTIAAGGLVPTTDWQELVLEDVSVSSAMRNLCVLLWIDDVAWAVTDQLYCAGVDLVQGDRARTYRQPDREKSVQRCQRYFEKTFGLDVTPAYNAGDEANCLNNFSTPFATEAYVVGWRFNVEKFDVPTTETYNPRENNDDLQKINGGSSNVPGATVEAGTKHMKIYDYSAPGLGEADLVVHATAEAVL